MFDSELAWHEEIIPRCNAMLVAQRSESRTGCHASSESERSCRGMPVYIESASFCGIHGGVCSVFAHRPNSDANSVGLTYT